jgi:hypothetical protein
MERERGWLSLLTEPYHLTILIMADPLAPLSRKNELMEILLT